MCCRHYSFVLFFIDGSSYSIYNSNTVHYSNLDKTRYGSSPCMLHDKSNKAKQVVQILYLKYAFLSREHASFQYVIY